MSSNLDINKKKIRMRGALDVLIDVSIDIFFGERVSVVFDG